MGILGQCSCRAWFLYTAYIIYVYSIIYSSHPDGTRSFNLKVTHRVNGCEGIISGDASGESEETGKNKTRIAEIWMKPDIVHVLESANVTASEKA